MFEPLSQSLEQIMLFSVLGFLIAVLYEPLRIIRLFIKSGAIATGIQDFLFLAFAGLILFAYSLEFGEGYFRAYYLIGVVFGATIYFLTLGKLISYITRTFANAIKAVVKSIVRFVGCKFANPLWKLLVSISQKSSRKARKIGHFAKNRSLLLKSNAQMMYNKRTTLKKTNKKSKKTKRQSKILEEQNGIQKTTIRARVVQPVRKT